MENSTLAEAFKHIISFTPFQAVTVVTNNNAITAFCSGQKRFLEV